METQSILKGEVLSYIRNNPGATKGSIYCELSMGAEYEVLQLVESGFLEDLSVSHPNAFPTGGGPYIITSKGYSFLTNKAESDKALKKSKNFEILKFLVPTTISVISLVISLMSRL